MQRRRRCLDSGPRKATKKITFTTAGEFNPQWMPDGRSLLFDSAEGGGIQIVRSAADGTGGMEVITRGPAGDPETISPDGKFFIYHTPAEVAMLALLNPSGPIRPLKPGNSKLLNAEISHDGRWIAYESNESGPKSSPITPALIGRTVKTVISILEPEQPDLIHALHQSLRTAAHTKQPVDLQYRIGGYGPMKHATVMDEGPQTDYLTIICFGTE